MDFIYTSVALDRRSGYKGVFFLESRPLRHCIRQSDKHLQSLKSGIINGKNT